MNRESDFQNAGVGRTSGVGKDLWVWFLMALLALTTGCKTTPDEANGGYPSVVIRGNTPWQILKAAELVMTDNAYAVKLEAANRLVCEKEAGTWDNVAYGNWIGSKPVVQRVRLTAVPLGEAVVRLDCKAFLVRDAGRSTEEELPIGKYRSGQFEKLLHQVAGQLSGTSKP